MWHRLKLGPKFSLLLTIVFLLAAALGGLTLWRVLQAKAQAEVEARGAVLLQMMNAVRSYTSEHINPLLQQNLSQNQDFIPEAIPAFSAREIFERVRLDNEFEGFFYKEAAANPSNLRDLGDDFELELLETMRQTPDADYAAYRTLGDERVYYIARPMRVTSEQCLACHGDPKDAPAGQLAKYGDQNGYGWKMNDVIAAQIVYVPADAVQKAALQSFGIAAGGMLITLALVLLVANTLLSRDIIHPIGVLGTMAQKLGVDEPVIDDLQSEGFNRITQRNDELGQTGQLFQRMVNEVHARTQNLKQQLRELRIEINETKRSQQVSEVVETDFFQELQIKAQQIRAQRQANSDPPPLDDTSSTSA